MGFSRGPKIVTNGLVLALDAGSKKSYQGSGNTITDVVGNLSGTLTNGPTFDSSNGGVLTFDGSNDYIDFGYIPNNFISNPALNNNIISFSIWVYVIGGYYIMSTGSQTSSTGISITYQNGSPFISIRTSNKQKSYSPGSNFNTNEWMQWCAVSDDSNWIIYKNGIQQSSQTLVSDSVVDAQTRFTLGVPNNVVTNYQFQGNIGPIQFYNKALSAAEILQNYNATKNRFI